MHLIVQALPLWDFEERANRSSAQSHPPPWAADILTSQQASPTLLTQAPFAAAVDQLPDMSRFRLGGTAWNGESRTNSRRHLMSLPSQAGGAVMSVYSRPGILSQSVGSLAGKAGSSLPSSSSSSSSHPHTIARRGHAGPTAGLGLPIHCQELSRCRG